jgi:MFS family permease
MATWTGATAFFEFLLNPTFGSLSDAYGRKPVMIIGSYFAIVLKAWVLFKPSLTSITVEKMVCDGLRTLTGSTMGTAAVSDLCSGNEMAVETAGIFGAMGGAILAAPLVGSQLSAAGSYKLSIAAAAAQLVMDSRYLTETLVEGQRKPFAGPVSPFGIFKLFSSGSALATASTVLALHNLVDMKILGDSYTLWMIQHLKFPRSKVSDRQPPPVGDRHAPPVG